MRTKSLLLPLAVAAASATSPAFADFNGGDFILRVGAGYMESDDSVFSQSQRIAIPDPNNPSDPDATILVNYRDSLDFDNDTTWFINGTYFIMDHFAIELYHLNSADLDASYNTYITGEGINARSSNGLGDFETSVTSFFVDWYPVCVESWIQPYMGIGFNYTDIEQDFLRPAFTYDNANYGLVNVGSSWGWTAQIGVDIEFGRNANWLFNASAMYVDAEPEIEIGADSVILSNGLAVNSIRYRDDLELDAWIFNLGVGYKFSF